MTTIVVNDQMQQNYRYTLTAQVGQDFHPEFKPQLTPKEMLERKLHSALQEARERIDQRKLFSS